MTKRDIGPGPRAPCETPSVNPRGLKLFGERSPHLDIIVLVHDNAEWADLCIRSVEYFTRNPYRLIVVDSGSKEPFTDSWLRNFVEPRGHTVLRLSENRSFSSGVNAGIRLGSAPFIVILNDDAIVTEGWDAGLLSAASQKAVGLAGSRSNFASGAQMDPSFKGDPPYLVMVCVCLRREVWDAVGPLDEETFDGFSSEDIDYAWRVRKAGYRLAVAGSSFVLHAGSRTLAKTVGALKEGETPSLDRQRADSKYTARLIDKWGKEWVARESRIQKRVLVVTYHAEEWTRVAFLDAFVNLKAFGGYAFTFTHVIRCPIQVARDKAYEAALDQGYDWLVQLDDDATFPVDVIGRLLSHGKEVVTALAYQRKPPHAPCVFELGEDGLLGAPMENIEHTGLRRVDVSGYHVSAVSTAAIKKLRDAKIRHFHGGFDNKVGEDFAVSLNFKNVGVHIHCDTDVIAGHIGESILVDEGYVQRFRGQR